MENYLVCKADCLHNSVCVLQGSVISVNTLVSFDDSGREILNELKRASGKLYGTVQKILVGYITSLKS